METKPTNIPAAAESGALLPMSADPAKKAAFIRVDRTLFARVDANGQMVYVAPINTVAVKGLWINDNATKFKYEPSTRKIYNLQLVPKVADEVKLLVTLEIDPEAERGDAETVR